jgi:hypothetical protein
VGTGFRVFHFVVQGVAGDRADSGIAGNAAAGGRRLAFQEHIDQSLLRDRATITSQIMA